MTLLNKIDIKKISNIFVFSISLIPLVLFLFIVWNRISLPFVFEWGESAGVNQIIHIMAGATIYGPPTLDFAPLVYTPLYYILAAGLSTLIGNALLSARIISLIAVITSAAFIFLIVYRENNNALLGWISAMSYLACFALSGGFFDLARVDSLYVLLVIVAFYVVYSARSNKAYLIVGLLMAVGFFLKQSFLIIFFPVMIFVLLKKWKIAWPAIVSGVVGLVIPLILINQITDNWFLYYILELPGEHGYSFVSAVNFWIGDSLRPLGLFFAFSLLYLFAYKLDLMEKQSETARHAGNKGIIGFYTPRESWLMYVLFFAGSALSAWITRSSNGGGSNNNMVLYAALSIVFGLGAGILLNSKWAKGDPWHYSFVLLLIAVQFIGLLYNPFNYLPTADEIRSNGDLIKKVSSSAEQTLIPYRSHLTEVYGEGPQIHIVNLFELTGYFKGEVQEEGYDLVNQIRANICLQKYGEIILDQPVPWFDEQIDLAYDREQLVDSGVYRQSMLLNWQRGSDRSYLPKEVYDNSTTCLDSVMVK